MQEQDENNKFLYSILGSFFVFLLVVGFYTQTSFRNESIPVVQGSTDHKSPVKEINVSQKIYTDVPIMFEGKVKAGTTALVLLKNKTEVKIQGEGTNAFVKEINKRKADEKKREFWALYVNGKQAEVGAGSYQLKEGDKVEWKIETY